MYCPACEQQCDAADNYCRHCGASLAMDLAVVRHSPPLPPASWQQVKPVVSHGVAVLAAGLALELLVRGIGRTIGGGGSRAVVPRPSNTKAIAARRPEGEVVEAFREMVYVRRVRRG